MAIFAVTWPYGHWVGLVGGGLIAFLGRRGAGRAERVLVANESFGRGIIEERRSTANRRVKAAMFAASASAIAALWQLVGAVT